MIVCSSFLSHVLALLQPFVFWGFPARKVCVQREGAWECQ